MIGQRVRFGSKADMCSAKRDVCFIPKADICPLDLDDHLAIHDPAAVSALPVGARARSVGAAAHFSARRLTEIATQRNR